MDKEQAYPVTLPVPQSVAGEVAVTCKGSLVIVGANGSGKTKLGSWLEFHSSHRGRVHRISAQKSLAMPDSSSPDTLERATKGLLWGQEESDPANKDFHRWNRHPETSPLEDFDKLLVYLFTEDYEQTSDYKKRSSETEERIPPPVTKLDTVKRIWEETLPHLKLRLRSAQVNTQAADQSTSPYNASAMSDGERVIFYHIGQSQAVPENGILVIDEPELHLHKSIQSALWDNIEAARPDVLFVYLTHDLEFAASRVGAKKIGLRKFDVRNGFDWFEIPEEADIPEEIFLKIIGSRKPILFVEGEKSSLDYFIFRHVFPQLTVIPRGSCDHVIQSTMSFNGARQLHSIAAFGLIDRDGRRQEELDFLRDKQKVFALDVLEVESLFLTDGVLTAFARALKIDPTGTDAILQKAEDLVFAELGREKERVVSHLAALQIESQIKRFDAKAQGEAGLKSSLTTLLASIDVAKIYAEQLTIVDAILKTKDYIGAIKVFSPTGLLAKIAPSFNFNKEGLTAFAKRLIQSNDPELIVALQNSIPQIV